jgi:hypothetical protein
MYTEREYVTNLKNSISVFLASIEKELVSQGRRPNRESEKRLRKLLGNFHRTIYKPYKDASLQDLKDSSTAHVEGV